MKFSGICFASRNIAERSFFQNSIFISPYVFRLYKAWIKGLSCGGTKRSACKKPCLISRICIFCYAKKKNKAICSPWRRKRFIVFCAFLKVKTCENTFIFRNTKRLQDLKNTSYAGIKSSKTDMSFFKKKALHYFYKDFTLIMYSLSARMQ